jgi:DNA-binding HxlR family transcriptional regulator
MTDQPRSGCPINAAVEVLGDRWSLIVLRDVMFGDRRHFPRLLTESEEGIASNILAGRLRSLVEAGLLTRDEAKRGQRATYSLTGQRSNWCRSWPARGLGPAAPPHHLRMRVRAEVLEAGGPQLWADFMDELRERHLCIPRPDIGRPAATGQLNAAHAAAVTEPRRSE